MTPERQPTLEEAAQPVHLPSQVPRPLLDLPDGPLESSLPGPDRAGPAHPPTHPRSLRRDGYVAPVRVFRDTWDRAGELGIDRAKVMREALEQAVAAGPDPEDDIRRLEHLLMLARGRAAVARQTASRATVVATAVARLRSAFQRYGGTSRSGMISWVSSRKMEYPELRRFNDHDLLGLLLEERPSSGLSSSPPSP